ncbi:putative virulence factor [Salmonella enterica subsp. arizonae]|uniref:Putative virulence factor n=1 Tax=Salmonella enterica subsp. arizonae TaxID=59203 RepID=A0A3S5DG54_SALER|nr:putative virulence factor [Salmonella enterica subsp. arizonae]
MLVNLCDYKQSVTLIANSGVQFLDFGLTPQESPTTDVLCAKRQTVRYCASILI